MKFGEAARQVAIYAPLVAGSQCDSPRSGDVVDVIDILRPSIAARGIEILRPARQRHGSRRTRHHRLRLIGESIADDRSAPTLGSIAMTPKSAATCWSYRANCNCRRRRPICSSVANAAHDRHASRLVRISTARFVRTAAGLLIRRHWCDRRRIARIGTTCSECSRRSRRRTPTTLEPVHRHAGRAQCCPAASASRATAAFLGRRHIAARRAS